MVHIDEHKRLQSVHAGTAHAASLPSALLDEPSRGDFCPLGQIIVRHVWIEVQQFGEFLRGHHRIHKEGACATHFRGIGQLRTAHLDDGIARLLCGRLLCATNTHGLQRTSHCFVRQNRSEMLAQPKHHMSYRKAMCTFVLEKAATISILTFIVREYAFFTARHFHRFHALNAIAGFYTVGTDVLHSACADLTGNEGEVFQPMVASFDTIGHQRVENLSRTDTQEQFVGCLGQNFLAHDLTVENHPVKIMDKEQITTCTDVHPCCLSEVCNRFFELLH